MNSASERRLAEKRVNAFARRIAAVFNERDEKDFSCENAFHEAIVKHALETYNLRIDGDERPVLNDDTLYDAPTVRALIIDGIERAKLNGDGR